MAAFLGVCPGLQLTAHTEFSPHQLFKEFLQLLEAESKSIPGGASGAGQSATTAATMQENTTANVFMIKDKTYMNGFLTGLIAIAI